MALVSHSIPTIAAKISNLEILLSYIKTIEEKVGI